MCIDTCVDRDEHLNVDSSVIYKMNNLFLSSHATHV